MAILFFWRGDNYRGDTRGGRTTGPLTLRQNAKAFSQLRPGDRVWAFTVRADRTYVLAAQARVFKLKKSASKYGRLEMAATPDSTVWYDVAHGHDAEPLVRRLGLKLGDGVLGASFQGHAAVRQLSDAADSQLEGFARDLPIVSNQNPRASDPMHRAVLSAIAEYDRLGQAAFLKKYRYWKAKGYVLVYKGKRYDSKAIYGVARGWRAKDFSGGKLTVKPWLEQLGFTIEYMRGAARVQAKAVDIQEEETSAGDDDTWENETVPDLPPVDEVVLNEVPAGSLLVVGAAARGGRKVGVSKDENPARHSRYAKTYGDHAELLVKRSLERLGKKDIRHCPSESLGYDLEYKEEGRLVAVEVKGTPRPTFKNFELTEREREAAERLGANFQLWLVANIRSREASVEIIRNPHQHLGREWTKTALVWRVERV